MTKELLFPKSEDDRILLLVIAFQNLFQITFTVQKYSSENFLILYLQVHNLDQVQST